MIRANHKKIPKLLFNWYLGRILKSDFSSFEWEVEGVDAQKPLLVLANHFSWWDGFFLYEVNRQAIHKKYHLMMLEEELAQRKFFTYLGAFSIKKGSRSVVESMKYASGLLQSAGNMVVIYPQGKIESLHKDRLQWEQGTARIIEKAGEGFQIVFSAAMPDYLASRKPSLKIYLSGYNHRYTDIKALEEAYNAFYTSCKAKQSAISI